MRGLCSDSARVLCADSKTKSGVLDQVPLETMSLIVPFVNEALEESSHVSLIPRGAETEPDSDHITRVKKGLGACSMALDLMTTKGISRQLRTEDTIERVVKFVANHAQTNVGCRTLSSSAMHLSADKSRGDVRAVAAAV